jgi:CelD/BcsL family acetyltransferase involved in cellulose biosynthesis
MPTDQPIFAISDTWFDCWSDAFGDQAYGVWQTRDAAGARLHYRREARTIAGLKLAVIKSATNLQTVRFDLRTKAETVDPRFALDLLRDTGADMLELDFLAPDAKALASLRSNDCGLPTTIETMARSPWVDCRGSFDEWLATRSPRKTWRRRERQALGDMKMISRLVTDRGEVETVLDEVLAVDERTWKSTVGGALKQDPAMARFYVDLASAAADAGALALYLLVHDGRIVAFEYNLRANGAMYLLKKGYLPEYQKISPGQVLTLRVLRDVFAEPDLQRYDMLGGTPKADPTKTTYATDEDWLYRVRAFAPTAKGRLAYVVHEGERRLKQTARPLWLWYKTNVGSRQAPRGKSPTT